MKLNSHTLLPVFYSFSFLKVGTRCTQDFCDDRLKKTQLYNLVNDHKWIRKILFMFMFIASQVLLIGVPGTLGTRAISNEKAYASLISPQAIRAPALPVV
ncbi:unnamed protein product [Polarella glacialis]|uniref:Uncharacterized protein n=1 Tax=Polarella glacialis TaxID=89957 RepID=A0A813JQM8_POLGL|nr:unnamed protein product [Polarella glacialis]